MDSLKKQMEEKVKILNDAAKAYYVDGVEIMSNISYDKLYDELLELEEKAGYALAQSPTQNVGYTVLSELPKERHSSKMLSLDKTKDRGEIASWLGERKGVLSWKLDGLTIVLTYEGGLLKKAVTRGDGVVGEVVTNNALTFINLPHKISYKGRLVVRGEAVISYDDFRRINSEIPEIDAKYKNPRNLCSGSVRQLNNEITAGRRVRFFAFALVSAEEDTQNTDFKNSRIYQMSWLQSQGFDVVEHELVESSNIADAIDNFQKNIEHNPIPSDGLVLVLDDIKLSESLGSTSKFPRDSIAFKWEDQVAETKLKEIIWSGSRTGLINPIAVFEPVELEGTTVSRASLHNVSIMEELKLAVGDTIRVFKANMIIPQIAENLTKSGPEAIPDRCPVCGENAKVRDENGVRTLHCTNPHCPAKEIKSLSHFVSRDAMNIDGLSEMTLEKFVDRGFVRDFAGIFELEAYRNQIINMEGFGEKSFNKLQQAVEKSRNTTIARVLNAIGILGIGLATANLISSYAEEDWDKVTSLTKEELENIDGIGPVLAQNFVDFFAKEERKEKINNLVKHLNFIKTEKEAVRFLENKVFVITGSLLNFKSRGELKELIENFGGKVSGSVSSNTSYLINNDVTSTSGKNKKAKELGIEIISEEEIMEWIRRKEIV